MQNPVGIYEDDSKYILQYQTFVAESDVVSWATAREGVPSAIENLVAGYPDNVLSVPNFPLSEKTIVYMSYVCGLFAEWGAGNFGFLNFKAAQFGHAGGTTGIYIDSVQNLAGYSGQSAVLHLPKQPSVIDFTLCAVGLSIDPATNFVTFPVATGRIRASISTQVYLIK